MPNEIRSIRIESSNICYGSEPGADDEVEQYLTISSTGRVWFSAPKTYAKRSTFIR